MVTRFKALFRVTCVSLAWCLLVAVCLLLASYYAEHAEEANVVYKLVRVQSDKEMRRAIHMEKQGWEFISAYRVVERRPGIDTRRIILVARDSWELASLSLSPGSNYFELLFKLTIYP
jgi:hypothetical protein